MWDNWQGFEQLRSYVCVGSVQALKRLKLAGGVQHASKDHS